MNGRLRDEYLEGELFNHRLEALVAIENYRLAFISQRFHPSFGYLTPNNFAQKRRQEQLTLN